MKRSFINPVGLHQSRFMSRAIKISDVGAMIYCSGMTPADENYQAVHARDLKGQYNKVKADCALVLEEAGADWDDVVSVRTYVRDMEAFMTLFRTGEIEVPSSRTYPPCSTVVEVSRLSDPEFLVEMEVVAALPSDRTVLSRGGCATTAQIGDTDG